MDYWEAQKTFKQGKADVTVTVKGKSRKAVQDFLKAHNLLTEED